jgi:aminoglycoside 2'-N-acetyltransferase I
MDRPAITLTVMPTRDLPDIDRQAIVALCTRAFARDFGSLFGFVTDSTHVLAYQDGTLVGHACWSYRRVRPAGHEAFDTAYIDAVATEPRLQGGGIGSAVMLRLAAEIQAEILGVLSTERVSFYTRLGWERWRGPTAVRTATGVIPTPDDTVMILRTPTTPPLDTNALLIADWRDGQPW